jgi:hypothetical protein
MKKRNIRHFAFIIDQDHVTAQPRSMVDWIAMETVLRPELVVKQCAQLVMFHQHNWLHP